MSRRFGGLVAVREVSLALQPGERRAIIGPNRAGKTTLFNVITGELRPTAGTIRFFGRDVTHLPPYQRIRLGLARTYQTPLVFRRLTVAENLYLAVRGVRPWRLSLRLPRRSDPEFREVEELAERVGPRSCAAGTGRRALARGAAPARARYGPGQSSEAPAPRRASRSVSLPVSASSSRCSSRGSTLG